MANVAFAYVDMCRILYQVGLAAERLITFQTMVFLVIR